MISFMSDFNKGDLPPEREKKEIYATVIFRLLENNMYRPTSQLDSTVNRYAMNGYDLDSITPLTSGGELLLVFKRSTRLS